MHGQALMSSRMRSNPTQPACGLQGAQNLMPGVVKCRIGNNKVTADIYPELMKTTIHSMLLEGVEHT